MTTTVTIRVNGRYKASVKQDSKEPVEVHGNYEGSPNPTGEHIFNLQHATSNKFVVSEEYLGDDQLATKDQQSVGQDDVERLDPEVLVGRPQE